jgi:hypothetical protein
VEGAGFGGGEMGSDSVVVAATGSCMGVTVSDELVA